MTVPFGFSVGDFVAAIELVGTVIDAVQASGQTSQRFRDLIRLLFSLETALIQVKDIQLHESMYAEHTALARTALECQRTIDDFWATARNYQPHITRPSTLKARETWMKIKWALCKQNDIDRLKIDLLGHTQALNIIMSAVKLKSEQIENQSRDTKHQTLVSLIQRVSNQYMGHLRTMFTQMEGILEKVTCAMRMDFRIFAAVMELQHIVRQIPGQVLNQQPVYLVDALGFQRPFHLETITSLSMS
ncbi:hypothetical protein PFICI_11710 [Pestalotiopsis fici W106-1]|uniref:Azaphilone pigments biosynthesis cluster protein L N-terminal domain-containing protein n=1 Tax=Pestalotiopsis fici (strain W106-1 / CGMCC3.15140) TaxID=1229662 RepID=W3WR55_PESFW|nr:uncharacterized protein PFICI_11710 [Pestalotiopsis fici W106-1]ETS76323.1 hypothetical protein PFICI_11710 [Pestalotiopsis fici W106-1]